ncbi:hypothetical protein [Caudoviricetes sp.]|nr:hypothetical protein [Caudoviricetes sp.]
MERKSLWRKRQIYHLSISSSTSVWTKFWTRLKKSIRHFLTTRTVP